MTDYILLIGSAIWAKAAGIAGSFIAALNFAKGKSFTEKLTMFISGCILSGFTSEWLSDLLHLPEGICGFGAGMFGMAVCAKAYEDIPLLWKKYIS